MLRKPSYKINFAPTIINFGLPMGLLGLGLNAEHLSHLFEFDYLAPLLLLIGLISFSILSLHYLYFFANKQSRQELLNEWHHPFTRSFLPAITLTALLALMGLNSLLEVPVKTLLVTTSIIVGVHLVINVYLINGWIFDCKVLITDHKPTWFILISGNFVAAISFMSYFRHQTYAYEVAMLFYAMGLFLWIAFATSILYRLMFEKPVSQNLRPSLFIFLAPPSLACVASIHLADSYILNGIVDSSSLGLVSWLSYSFASVMFMLWIAQSRYFISSGLSMAGWSYVYPLAAYGLATQYMSQALDSQALKLFSFLLMVFVLGIIILLFRWLFNKFINFS